MAGCGSDEAGDGSKRKQKRHEPHVLPGDRALRVNAPARAAHYYARALELTPTADDATRPQLLFAHARALFESGAEGRGAALEEARLALAAANDVEGAAEADTLLADVAWMTGRRTDVDKHLERAITHVRDTAPSATKARILASVARLLMLYSEPTAVHVAREALALAAELRLRDTEAQALVTLGTARWQAGDYGGVADIERGLALALEHGALSAAQRGYNNLAATTRDIQRSIELLEQAEQTARRLGDPVRLRFVQARLISQRYARGDWGAALREADEFIGACERGSPHIQEAAMRTVRASIRFARDDGEGAVEDTARALALSRESGLPEGRAEVLNWPCIRAARTGLPYRGTPSSRAGGHSTNRYGGSPLDKSLRREPL